MNLTIGENVYIDLAFANDYFSERLYSQAWTAASDPDREKALCMATEQLDALAYKGERSSSSQLLAWPRRYVVDNECRGVAADLIPENVKAATAEWAIYLLAHDPAQSTPTITRKQVGDLQIDYAASLPDPVPVSVRHRIAGYLLDSPNTARLIP